MSSWKEVFSGVPQGSVLGPILFVLFIDDIDSMVSAVDLFLSKFADDTKAARVVDSDEQAADLQADLDGLSQWATKWQMLFNVDKCKVLHLGRSNIGRDYTMGGKKLLVTEEEKDLGVMIHKSLKSATQVAKAAKKANQVLGQIARAFTYRDKVHFVKLYRVYGLCHLEYSVQSWSPHLQQDIDVLEAVQRRAVRMISGLRGSYEEKLGQVGLTTLSERRVRGDMIQTYKILHQVDDLPVSTFFNIAGANHNHATRLGQGLGPNDMTISTLNLAKPTYNREPRSKFFSHRVVDQWNSLPSYVKFSTSVNNFKNNFDNHKRY